MVEIEDRGLPTVYVATTEFIDGGVAQAKALGANPAAIFVHHPIQDRTDEEMREIARDALSQVLTNLVSD